MGTQGGAGFTPGTLVPVDVQEAVDDLLGFTSRTDQRFSTGWSLDDSCGTVGVGEMALLWARSGSGKSTWLLNVVANTPEVPTVVFNMEMMPRRQIEWLAAMTFDLKTPARLIEEKLRENEPGGEAEEIVAALKQMSEVYPHTHFVSPAKPSVSDFGTVIDDITDMTGVRPQRVFIDHMTLIKGAEDYGGVTRTAAELHEFAMKEGVALYVCQQTGRGGGDGSGARNDGHLPVTLSSGVYGGDPDADWVFGLYRPDRNPKFKKKPYDFKSNREYDAMCDELAEVRGVVVMQVIKNRPFGETRESGVEFLYHNHSRRYEELGSRAD